MKKEDRLRRWQGRFERALGAYRGELEDIKQREKLYNGDPHIEQLVCRDFKNKTSHVRNIVAEMIESQVDPTIPQPKVTARRREYEPLARIIEDMIRNELDRLPMEEINDELSRLVPIHGGAGLLVEWDPEQRTHLTAGEVAVSSVHPSDLIPQDGVYKLKDMDYFFLRIPQTRAWCEERYGVDLQNEAGNTDNPEETVTMIRAYYKGERGIGLFSWVGDTVLEDMEHYQARQMRRCAKCGAPEPAGPVEPPDGLETGETLPTGDPERDIEIAQNAPRRPGSGHSVCPYCGSAKWERVEDGFEVLGHDIVRFDGSRIKATEEVSEPTGELDDLGVEIVERRSRPVKIPYMTPDIWPVMLIKNVSQPRRFLGGSDVDKIAYQQNTSNRVSAKINDKLFKSGFKITLPVDTRIREDGEDAQVIRLDNPAEKDMIGVFEMEGNISQDLAWLQQVYEEARQGIGVTDSFQGRRDATATSGKAKEFSAAQAAGRMESKRVMRNAAYAELFRMIFLHKLAYADEPRSVVTTNVYGDSVYKEFHRYDFLRQDDAGEWFWVDDSFFLFSTDVTAPLANNREAMWQETRNNFQAGAFGPVNELPTLISFWTKMALLHYPGAEDTKKELEERLKREQAMQQLMMQLQNAGTQPGAPAIPGSPQQEPAEEPQVPPQLRMAIEEQARRAAMQNIAGRQRS